MGSGIQNLNVDSVRKYRVPISSIEEQREIVRLVDARLDSVSRLDKEIEIMLIKSEKNKQSILAAAFNGDLE